MWPCHSSKPYQRNPVDGADYIITNYIQPNYKFNLIYYPWLDLNGVQTIPSAKINKNIYFTSCFYKFISFVSYFFTDSIG